MAGPEPPPLGEVEGTADMNGLVGEGGCGTPRL